MISSYLLLFCLRGVLQNSDVSLIAMSPEKADAHCLQCLNAYKDVESGTLRRLLDEIHQLAHHFHGLVGRQARITEGTVVGLK